MRRGHAGAVVLLGGWLLLTPPIKRRGGEADVDEKMPVKKWDQLSAYDTARACRDAIDYHFQLARKKHDELHTNMYATARCIVTVRWTAGSSRRRYMMRSQWRVAEG